MTKTALILGATGRFGRNMTQALQAAGWNTRPFDRKLQKLDVVAKNIDVIVYGWNPKYDKWTKECPDQIQQVIDAAHISDAAILFPGNIYVYGTEMPENLNTDTPHCAAHTLGIIRSNMEAKLKESGIRTLILRAGDFIDTQANGNWFDMVITKNTHKNGKISYPGNPGIPHSWAYLPDYTHTFAALANKLDDLPQFTSLNFAGYTMTGCELANILNAKVQKMSWLPIQISRPFWPLGRCLLEMRYLWNTPHQMNNDELKKLLPNLQHTPLKTAMQSAVSFEIDPHQPVVGAHVTV